MNLSKYLFSPALIPLLVFFSSSGAFGQTDTGPLQLEPSYEIALHVVIGSNEGAARTDLPSSLSNVARHLRGNYTFTNYRLANTFLGRISNTGNIEYKSVSNILGQDTDPDAQTFLEWSLANFRTMQNGFQARSFRFGARVPVRSSVKDSAGTVGVIVNYEPVGLTMSMLGLRANTPTLIGTISLPKTTGTIFLIATITTADV